ncbi:MAG: translation elongation factor Ts [Rhabdochlamydiaceae bacterium]|jgi:elongation factor Ts
MTVMKVTPDMVKQLRERTGVGMGKCKEALDQASGDMEKAIDILRKAGMASAVKKEGRETKEGVIASFETPDAISLVEINAETDFVVQNDKFKTFAHDIAKQAALSQPVSLEALLAQPANQDKTLTVDQYRAIVMQSLGENIKIKRVEIFKKEPTKSFGIYSHMGGKIVTLVEITGKSAEPLAREIAMHVAAESPDYLKPEEVPASVRAREEEIARGQVVGKPPQIVDKIVEGKLKAFYDQVCLLGQKFVKDNSITIADLVANEAKKSGHPLTLKWFLRWKVGD